MAFYMMHAYQRQLFRVADRLCFRHSHKKGAHKARPVSDAYGVQIIQSHARSVQSFLDHLIDFFDMLPGSDFRHHASIKLVQLNLR